MEGCRSEAGCGTVFLPFCGMSVPVVLLGSGPYRAAVMKISLLTKHALLPPRLGCNKDCFIESMHTEKAQNDALSCMNVPPLIARNPPDLFLQPLQQGSEFSWI